MFDSGIYVFVMRLREPCDIEVGSLGRFVFPAGWYLYTGSARRNLRGRIERHWNLKKTLRWHIDHLSTAPDSEPVGAVVLPLEAGISECALNQRVGRMIAGRTIAPGFGASDCLSDCPAHLWYSRAAVSLLAIARIHPEAGVLIPGADIMQPDLQSLLPEPEPDPD